MSRIRLIGFIFLSIFQYTISYFQSNYFEYFVKSFNDSTTVLLEQNLPKNFYRMIYLSDTAKKICLADFYYNCDIKSIKKTCGCNRNKAIYYILTIGKTKNNIWFIAIVTRGKNPENYLFTYDKKHRIFGVFEVIEDSFWGFDKKLITKSFKSYSFSPFSIYKWDPKKCILGSNCLGFKDGNR